MTDATTGFTVNLTLPYDSVPTPKVCQYTGSAGDGWDCAVTGSDTSGVRPETRTMAMEHQNLTGLGVL